MPACAHYPSQQGTHLSMEPTSARYPPLHPAYVGLHLQTMADQPRSCAIPQGGQRCHTDTKAAFRYHPLEPHRRTRPRPDWHVLPTQNYQFTHITHKGKHQCGAADVMSIQVRAPPFPRQRYHNHAAAMLLPCRHPLMQVHLYISLHTHPRSVLI